LERSLIVFWVLVVVAVVILSVMYVLARPTHDASRSVATLIAAEMQAKGEVVKKAFRDHRFGDFVDATEDLISRASPSARASERMSKAYLLLATAQLAAGRDEAAEASFKEFLDRSSDQDAARKLIALARADALLIAGRFPDAAPLYEAAVAEHETPEAFAGLAMCRIRLGEARLAARDLDRAVGLGFDAERAKTIRAQILADYGRTDEALELAREATSADEPTDDAAYTLVYVLVAARHPEAEARVREYVASKPNDPDLPALLARPAPNGGTWRDQLDRTPPVGD
jgi:tetratricopeptide (TPR) repeat protein